MEYQPTIGLEIHVELKTKTKMFCNSANDPDEKHPNINICPVCLGHPGTLPTINKEAINKLIQVGLALNCEIAEISKFDRKNYFYPDLPKGYQISQYDLPLCQNGWLILPNGKKIQLERIHIEEDTGKLIHPSGVNYSLVDFNRAGVPLMELVTMPELESGKEVEQFAKELQLILRYLGASDADMEKGQMRVEVNISISNKRQATGNKLGTKVEIKNINSINAAARAVDYEIKRQSETLAGSGKIVQETRGWNEDKQETFSQRTKEGAADYRYFPEPDLPPLKFKLIEIEEIRLGLPELPAQRRTRFKEQYSLNDAQIEIFTIAKNFGAFFESVTSELDSWDKLSHLQRPSKESHKELYTLAANYLITEFPPLFKMTGKEIDELEGIKITPEAFGEMAVRIFHKELSSTAAKAVLGEMFQTGLTPGQIIARRDLGQISDRDELGKIVAGVIEKNPKAAEDYKKGKIEVLKFLVGQVMVQTRGKANPQIIGQLLEEKLKSS